MQLGQNTIRKSMHITGYEAQCLFTRTPYLRVENPLAMRQCLRDYFVSTFDKYESLFQTLACNAASLGKIKALAAVVSTNDANLGPSK